jgi:hypothetical protein
MYSVPKSNRRMFGREPASCGSADQILMQAGPDFALTSETSILAGTDPESYTRWLSAGRAVYPNPPTTGKVSLALFPHAQSFNRRPVNLDHSLVLPTCLVPLAWRDVWERQMATALTRDLNRFLRTICRLDLTQQIAFAYYSRSEQSHAIAHMCTVLISMSRSDAMHHLCKAVTVYAGEKRRLTKRLMRT